MRGKALRRKTPYGTTVLAFGLLLTLGLTGCGGDGGGDGVATAGGKAKASSSAPSEVDAQEAARQFGKCMRENGVPDFEDPEVEDGKFKIHLEGKPGLSKETVEAAHEKCKKYLPDGGEPPKADPELRDQQLAYAKCMRENGVPKFPDPDPDGGLRIDSESLGMNPDDPRFREAEKKCEKLMPGPRKSGSTQRETK